ncbi:metal-sulfur cluster assembly factor [Micromonospora lupini]|uniref:metal-sulfur cluster assembly factor n=1 Tax=Micromonospora lupini TaxID=285679 RepID=UPI0033C9157F
MSENTATAATPEAGDATAAPQTDAVTTDGAPTSNVAATTNAAATPAAGDGAAADGAATPGAGDAATSAGGVSKAMIADIEEAMKDVVDPELGINVVDLGLVYGVHVDDENVATLDMTLTSAACPLTDVIEDQTRQALTTGPGGGLVNDIRINWVWLPPWGPDKITDEGRDQLRSLGFNV